MDALGRRTRRGVQAIAGLGLFFALLAPVQSALGQQVGPTTLSGGKVARLAVRVTSAPSAPTVAGVLVALDASGQAVANLTPGDLQATLDGKPVDLSLVPGRPS